MGNPLIDGFIIGNYADGETGWGASMDSNLSRLGWLSSRAVLTLGANTPPLLPAVNDRHVVGTAPTGLWALNANKQTRWTGLAWEFLPLVTNLDVVNYADGNRYKWNGAAWVVVASTSVPVHAATHLPGGADALPWAASIHGSGLFAALPAAAAANAGFLYFATDVPPSGQLFRSNGVAWVAVAAPAGSVPSLRQTAAVIATGAASNATTTYANLASVPITITAGGILIISLDVSANIDTNSRSFQARLRVDGAVADPTVAGRGGQSPQTPAANTRTGVSIALRIAGLSVGAHTVFADWRMVGTGIVSINPTANPDADNAAIIVSETGI